MSLLWYRYFFCESACQSKSTHSQMIEILQIPAPGVVGQGGFSSHGPMLTAFWTV